MEHWFSSVLGSWCVADTATGNLIAFNYKSERGLRRKYPNSIRSERMGD